MSFVRGLQCRECGQEYPRQPIHICETCFGPLEIVYDYEGIKKSISREKIASRDKNLWRYRELLPLDGWPEAGLYSGFTPLVRARRLGEALGVKQLYIKDDSVNHPTFSYKDRVVAVISITGNGYKTLEAVAGRVEKPLTITATLESFDELYEHINPTATAKPQAVEIQSSIE